MTIFKKVWIGFIGSFIFAVLPLGYAQNMPGPDATTPKWHAGQRIQEIYSQLNLTDDQKKQLEINKRQHRARMEVARQEMKTVKQALQEALMQPQLDMFKVKALHGQIKALLSKMEDDKLNSILAVRSILTPEQFSKFVSLMQRHRQEHGE